MRNYNQEYVLWLEKVKDLAPKSIKDLPEDLQREFERLVLLASIPFREVFGQDPDAMVDLLRVVLTPEVFYDEHGAPLHVVQIEESRVFEGPVNQVIARPALFVQDDRGRYYAFLYCDWRGPYLGEAAAIFDSLHDEARSLGLAEQDFPDIYFIYLTDYDLARKGKQITRLDFDGEAPVKKTKEEWIAEGCDPDQPDPVVSKWHTIFYNVAMRTE